MFDLSLVRFGNTRSNVVLLGDMDGTSVNFAIVRGCTIDSKSQMNMFIHISGCQKRYLTCVISSCLMSISVSFYGSMSGLL